MSYTYMFILFFKNKEYYYNKKNKIDIVMKNYFKKWDGLDDFYKEIYKENYYKGKYFIKLNAKTTFKDHTVKIQPHYYDCSFRFFEEDRRKKPYLLFQIEDFKINDDYDHNIVILNNFVKDLCISADAFIAFWLDYPNKSDIEYYEDPYYFCLNLNNDDSIFEKENINFINKIKKFLSKERLIEILKEYSVEVFYGENGMGVIKGKRDNNGNKIRFSELWFPRYFIRKKIRDSDIELSYDGNLDNLPEKFREVKNEK